VVNQGLLDQARPEPQIFDVVFCARDAATDGAQVFKNKAWAFSVTGGSDCCQITVAGNG
jgi:hypothetical protein